MQPIVQTLEVMAELDLAPRLLDATEHAEGHVLDEHRWQRLAQETAFVFGAWAPGAVINADLPFHTRHDAELGPEKLRVSMRINIAVGVIAAASGLPPDAARDVLREEARRAGLTEADHASLVIRRQTRDDG
jgi:hypothetical protein